MKEKQKLASDKQEKVDKFRILNKYAKKGATLFVGSSLMEGFPINEFLMDYGMTQVIYNRGIGGFTIPELYSVRDVCIFDLRPEKIFINIGTNDIASEGYTLERLIENYRVLLCQIREKLPQTEVYMMAYYPVNETEHFDVEIEWQKHIFEGSRTNRNIQEANKAVEKLAEELSCHFINVNRGLFDEKGQLKREYTIEGLHMYANGYHAVFEELKGYL